VRLLVDEKWQSLGDRHPAHERRQLPDDPLAVRHIRGRHYLQRCVELPVHREDISEGSRLTERQCVPEWPRQEVFQPSASKEARMNNLLRNYT
jgi:hypothetical protein